ncbi:restriction endonuclease [Brachyspira hyodysenteriae]|uniref:restriction endonuclease n=1 Tax=Brachyspira hyodysenteriae TaxID=159 RepID=UPI0022CD4C30|nr:restriction endonuclease [Brachyspira hyodysenteriae]MCZ9870898.1 restriction endonuclease [Brachyspira hyodysenteriae]MCZ9879937.1 restriction endonuclease [Brachyspira hyodysenteriae]MCZ9892136.1 restriction endonuclease [Brachyspira hyodysenteriae]MCZ9898161.1 restriction endonuclease [Brachyspira hyodysenteriae]MCZ9952880.1 restriction endonuclease [Brachyspira hyodysenteriae]
MNNSTLYIIIAVIFIIILISTIIMIKNIFIKKVHKPSKNTKKKMHELRKTVSLNPKDLDSLYELALIEEEYEELSGALPKYEFLLSKRYFKDNDINEIEIYKKLEEGYDKLENKENSFKYAMMISKLEPNNIDYAVKIGNVLGQEGKYKLASEYFNKVIIAKENLSIEEARTAALSFFMIKDYKKSIIFLETLYKKILNNKEADISEIHNIEILLMSLYISADELNRAITFLEQILSNKNIKEDHKMYINRIYMYILYKLSDNDKFLSKYKELKAYYKLDEAKEEYAALIFDFAFYSYFLKDIDTSISYFKKLNSFHKLEYSVYYLDQILEYLNEVNKAFTQLTKLRNAMKLNDEKYKNENYEKYIDSELIDIWELVLSLWQGTFIKFDYITSNTTQNPENKMDIDKILAELNNASNENDNIKNTNLNEIDKIYSLNLNNFKKLCKNLIQNKLSYSIMQEYTDNVISYNYGDEVNYLAYHITKSRKDLTLISVKRWKNTEVGELIIRDFLLMVNESGAKNGILILPVRLSNSAKSYAKHNDKITVYTRSQFNSFLKSNFTN